MNASTQEFSMGLTDMIQTLGTAMFAFATLLNVLMLTGLVLSKISRTHSLRFMEFVYTLIWVPFSLIFNVRVSMALFTLLSPAEMDDGVKENTFRLPPPWIRHLLLLLTIETSQYKYLFWLLYLVCSYCLLSGLCTHPTLGRSKTYRPLSEHTSLFSFTVVEEVQSDRGQEFIAYFSENHFQRYILTLLSASATIYISNVKHTLLRFTHCLVSEKIGLDLFERTLAHTLSSIFEADETILCHLLYEISEVLLVVVTALAFHGVGLQFITCVILNLCIPCYYLITVSWPKYHTDLEQMAEFPCASRQQLNAYDDICAICLYQLFRGRVTPCGHIFHANCLRRSKMARNTCPLCNTSLERGAALSQ